MGGEENVILRCTLETCWHQISSSNSSAALLPDLTPRTWRSIPSLFSLACGTFGQCAFLSVLHFPCLRGPEMLKLLGTSFSWAGLWAAPPRSCRLLQPKPLILSLLSSAGVSPAVALLCYVDMFPKLFPCPGHGIYISIYFEVFYFVLEQCSPQLLTHFLL